MPTTTGSISLTVTATSKKLVLTSINPSPPPPTIETEFLNPPDWLWNAVVGNAGRTAAVTHDGQTPPVPSSAVVS